MCLYLKAIIKVNQPSSSSSTVAAAAGAGAVAVAVVIFFCTVCPTGMLLTAVKDRKQINVCQIRTCVHVHVFTVKKMLQGTGNKLNLSTTKLNQTTGLTLIVNSKQIVRNCITGWWPDPSSLKAYFDVISCHGSVPGKVKHWKKFSFGDCPSP